MNPTTYRVGLEYSSFRRTKNEWRLGLCSTRADLEGPPHYTAFASADVEALDRRLMGLKFVPLRDGDVLDVDMVWGVRRRPDGSTSRWQMIHALRVVPAESLSLSPEDVCLVLAEAKAIRDRCPGATSEQVTETILDLLDGIVDGITSTAILALVEANHEAASAANGIDLRGCFAHPPVLARATTLQPGVYDSPYNVRSTTQ